MTTLVGIMYKDGENKKVIIGADSRVTLGQVKTTIKDSKIFILKGSDKQRYLMAICGLEKILNLTKYSFKVPNRDPKRKDDYDFLINQFMPSLEHFFKEKEAGKTKKNYGCPDLDILIHRYTFSKKS